mmetsp:Transcript_3892/g.13712  ORF Transcript_3892/g.13712 Transcript_3892/m.13712 type:complete len:235 (-) Transcript_3892:522-1226(-)
MMGVAMFFEALMISLMRGTPSVTFIDATPAKWNVLSVICVPGSPMLCAPTAPTALPGSMRLRSYLAMHSSMKNSSCLCVVPSPCKPSRVGSASEWRNSLSRLRKCSVTPCALRLPSKARTCSASRSSAWSILSKNAWPCKSSTCWSSCKLRGRSARARISCRLKSTGLSPPSISTGSSPSSPYTSCTIPPELFRTLLSYLVLKSSSAFMSRRDMYPVSAVLTAVSTRPSRPPIV